MKAHGIGRKKKTERKKGKKQNKMRKKWMKNGSKRMKTNDRRLVVKHPLQDWSDFRSIHSPTLHFSPVFAVNEQFLWINSMKIYIEMMKIMIRPLNNMLLLLFHALGLCLSTEYGQNKQTVIEMLSLIWWSEMRING